jgi:hypothetical protein
MTKLTDSVHTVEVPSMAFGLMVNNYGNESELMYMLSMSDITDDDNTEETLITKKLPPGNWRILCTTREVTPLQAGEVVEHDGDGWKDYDTDRFHHDLPFMDPLNSLSSLLTSKGLDVSKNHVLLERG